MNKPKMVLYAGLGSLISVLIWSFIGGCHNAPDKTNDSLPAESASLEEETPALAEIEETMIEEGIVEEKTEAKVAVEKPPVDEPPVTELPSPEVRFHTVEKGDSLWAISRSCGVSLQAIQEANALDDPGSLSIGQKLRIPRI